MLQYAMPRRYAAYGNLSEIRFRQFLCRFVFIFMWLIQICELINSRPKNLIQYCDRKAIFIRLKEERQNKIKEKYQISLFWLIIC